MIEQQLVTPYHKVYTSFFSVNKISYQPYQVMNSDVNNDFLVDTGASVHVISNIKYFTNLHKNSNSETSFLEMADGTKSCNIIVGKGTAKIPIIDIKGEESHIVLNDALFVPTFSKNIISVSQAIKMGFKFNFNHIAKESMVSPNGNIFRIVTKGNLYYLNHTIVNSVISRSLDQWHRILGHQNFDDINKLPEVSDNMKIVKDKKPSQCEICIKAKMVKNISKAPDARGTRPFQKIHIDLNGPVNTDNIIDGNISLEQ